MAKFLELRPREKAILYQLSEGRTLQEVADQQCISINALYGVMGRTCKREGCQDSMQLVVRYMHEYRGVMDAI